MAFGPKKSELRIGQSSAFFTYVKSTILGTTTHHIDDVTTPLLENNLSLPSQPITTINLTDETTTQYVHVDEKVTENTHHTNAPENNYNYNYNHNHNHPDISTYNPYSPYPYYHLSGPMMMSSMYQQSQYNHIPPHHMQGMGSYPYYPINLFQPGQMPAGMHNQWPVNDSNSDVKVHKLDRREAALLKFRQKRKERCFDKKIRYVNRKKLAERRPRVRGQFVRKINGIDVDLNGQPTCNDFDEDDDDDVEEEDDDDDDRVGGDSSPENNYSGFHS